MSENNQTTKEQTTSESTPESTSTPASSSQVSPNKQKKGNAGWILVAVLALVLIAFFVQNKFGIFGGASPEGTDGVVLDANAIIATAENITVTRGELDEKMDQVRRSLPPDAVDPTQDAAFELQLLDDLISLKLLTAEAENKNYTVSDDEINAEMTALAEQFGGQDALNQQLDALGITQEELLENMRNELLIRQLLDEETSITDVVVTDAEIAEAYTAAVGDAEDAPPLDQVSEMLRTEITNQKSAEIIQAYVDDLRSDIDVEVTL